jgi:hypothetical protein
MFPCGNCLGNLDQGSLTFLGDSGVNSRGRPPFGKSGLSDSSGPRGGESASSPLLILLLGTPPPFPGGRVLDKYGRRVAPSLKGGSQSNHDSRERDPQIKVVPGV